MLPAATTWLMKTEPASFSLDDLAAQGSAAWDGVRNYQARNFLREMKCGDSVLIYHSSCAEPAIVGLACVSGEHRPDPTQWQQGSPGYDPKSTADNPRWSLVEVTYLRHFPRPVTLKTLRSIAECKDVLLLTRPRLSVMPISPDHLARILRLAGAGE